jgi:hypothetical protein
MATGETYQPRNSWSSLMPDRPSLLDELRAEYDAARQSPHGHADVPGFQDIDAQMRKSFRWLEKAIAYLDGLKPAIAYRFDLGHGLVFESGQHQAPLAGFHGELQA